jgi:hypothetical protein
MRFKLKFKKMVEEAYTQQGRAHSRRLRPDWAARPALITQAAHAVESKGVVRIEVAVSWPMPWGLHGRLAAAGPGPFRWKCFFAKDALTEQARKLRRGI